MTVVTMSISQKIRPSPIPNASMLKFKGLEPKQKKPNHKATTCPNVE